MYRHVVCNWECKFFSFFHVQLKLRMGMAHGERIAQCQHIKLVTNRSLPVQIDGGKYMYGVLRMFVPFLSPASQVHTCTCSLIRLHWQPQCRVHAPRTPLLIPLIPLTPMHACTRTHTHTHAHAHTRTRTHTHTHAHARTRTHTHTHIRTHAHTHTHTQRRASSNPQ